MYVQVMVPIYWNRPVPPLVLCFFPDNRQRGTLLLRPTISSLLAPSTRGGHCNGTSPRAEVPHFPDLTAPHIHKFQRNLLVWGAPFWGNPFQLVQGKKHIWSTRVEPFSACSFEARLCCQNQGPRAQRPGGVAGRC